MDFARSAVALSDDASGKAMKATVSDVITLQAVWFALQHLEDLDADEQAIGLDRAAILIERSEASIGHHWRDAARPEMIDELIQDAREMLETASKRHALDTDAE